MKSYVPKRGDRVTLNSIPATVVSVDPEQRLAGAPIRRRRADSVGRLGDADPTGGVDAGAGGSGVSTVLDGDKGLRLVSRDGQPVRHPVRRGRLWDGEG